MPDLIPSTIISIVSDTLTGLSNSNEMDETVFLQKLEAAHVALDSLAYTVNPNSTYHPSTIRR